MPLNGDNCYLSVEGKDLQEIGKWKTNGHQGIICPFTGAFFHNMQTCLSVYTYNRSQVSVYRTIGPLVFHTISCPPYNLKTVREISLKLGTLIKHDETMCHAQEL